MTMTANRLILGDNLEIMRGMEAGTVDLVYLDPPFFSNRNYEVIWGDEGEVRSFQDRWAGGIEHYIAWLKERVIEMHRLLKPTGSIFLHCDWHADAYIRVEILDKIFGESNFQNHIIWKRKTGRGETNHKSNKFGVISDSIYFYSKSTNKKRIFNSQFSFAPEGYSEYVDKFFIHTDEQGRRYRIDNLASPNPRPNLMYEYKGYQPPKNGWAISLDKMKQFEMEGRLHFPKDKSGRIQRRRFLDELQGKPIQNIWDDIEIVTAHSLERIGYPTQKPEALLQRIIECASNEGDIVLDPFVGGGTLAVVADRLKRRWIGVDQSVAAIKVSDLRLKKNRDLYSKPYELQLRTYDYDVLRNQDAFAFETWIIEKFGGIANEKQRSDFGLDGRMPDNTPIQVKRSDNIGRNVIDNFLSAVQRSDKRLFEKNKKTGKSVGYIIAFSFGKGAIEEAARLKNKEQIIIELVKVGDILPLGNPPKVSLSASELEQYKYSFEASAESETGIEFYSWDFDHNPEDGFKAEVYLDKEGKQVRKFEPGEHQIAVEATDKNGLDGMDKIEIKVKK